MHHIRYESPTQDMIDSLSKDGVLCHSQAVTENVYDILKHFPESLVLTVTHNAASFINEVIISNVFKDHPLALVVSDNESLTTIHKGMKLMLTRNVDKCIGYVNGQLVTVQCISGETITATHLKGHIINIFAMTTIIDDIPVTKYPFLPEYATTISKVQGQTLPNVILWFDTEISPPGTAYVALSRVSIKDLHFLAPIKPTHFTPVAI